MEPLPGYTIIEERTISPSRSVCDAVASDGAKVLIDAYLLRGGSMSDLAAFKSEIDIIRGLPEGAFVGMRDVIYRHDRVILVLDAYPGTPLESYFNNEAAPVKEALLAGIRIAAALEIIHSRGVIHRNLNPSSILVKEGLSEVRFTEPGAVLLLTRESDAISDPAVVHTRLACISPEQTGRIMRTPDHRSDLYSLGAVLYGLLAGHPPFRALGAMELIHAHLAHRPLPIHEERPEVPRMVSDIVLKLLAKSPEDRYQTAYGLRVDLEECLHQVAESGMVRYFPAGAYDIPERLVIPRKLYGRESEMEILESSFSRARLGFPELVLVAGADGSGKTALAGEFQEAVMRHGCNFVYGKFEEMKRHAPFSAFIQAFQSFFRRVLSESDEEAGKWRKKLSDALGAAGGVIADVIPEVGILLGDLAGPTEAGPEESRNRFNRAFQGFARLFAGEDAVLVLFLDDLHWADPASLSLIVSLFRESDLKHFMIVATFREGADAPGGEIARAFDGPGVPVRKLILGPIREPDLAALVGESLRCGPERARSLAGILLEKTGGMPILIAQYLRRLADEGVIACNPGRGWEWDDDTIRSMSVADNLADMLSGRVMGLGDDARKALEWAACFGGDFDLEDLAGVMGASVEDLLRHMENAAKSGLVIQAAGKYRFAHDRIRDAVFERLGDGDRMMMRLRIGNHILKRTAAPSLEEGIFSIVDHLNAGAGLIGETYDRMDLARLNLMAGIKAKRSTAYLAAARYLAAAESLLPQDRWERSYELTYEILFEKMKCEYMSGNFREAEEIFRQLENGARPGLDLCRACNIIIMLNTSSGKNAAAVEYGFRALGNLGIRLPKWPSRMKIFAEMRVLNARLRGKKAGTITALPPMEDEVAKTACETLINMVSPAYFSNSRLMASIVITMVKLVLRRGNTDPSPMIFVSFAGLVGNLLGDHETAGAIARGALKLADDQPAGKYRCKVHHIFALAVNHWTAHARGDAEHFLRAYNRGLESGDFMYAAHSMVHMIMARVIVGDNLDDIFTECRKYEGFLRRTGDPFVIRNFEDSFQMYLNHKGLTESRDSLNSHGYDEDARIGEVRRGGNIIELFYHLLTRARVLYLAGHVGECLRFCEEMESIKRIPMGTLQTAEHCFYYSLALAACGDALPLRARLRRLKKNRKEMRRWAAGCPDNFMHKLHLIDAEIARLSGDGIGAMRHYRSAAEAARAAGYVQNQAIAHERAALFYEESGFEETAGLYFELAFKCYLDWGGDSKVYDMRERYAPLRERLGSNIAFVRHRRADMARMVDTEAMVKALLSISGEIVIEKLMEELLAILLESSGAERCFLLLEKDGALNVVAEGPPGEDGFRLKTPLPAEMHGGIPQMVVNYVKRTMDAVVLGDACADGIFREDAVIRGRMVRSLLCAPLVRGKNLVGMVYMENNLTSQAFQPEKIEMVRLLSAQAAIALENAILYEKARSAEQESYSQCQEIQGQYEELEAMYEEMEAMNQEMSKTSRELMDANANLAESEARYRLLAENLTDVIWTMDLNLKFHYVSPSVERLSGFTPEEILSMELTDILTRDSIDRALGVLGEEFRRDREGGDSFGRSRVMELEEKRKDGSTVWIEVRVSFLYDGEGKPNLVLGVSRDITERHRAIERIRSTRNYLNSILNSLPSMLMAVDKEGYILQWNGAAEEYFKIPRESAMMTYLWETVPFMAAYRDIVHGVIENGKPIELHRESVFLGEEKFFDIAMYPLSLTETGGAVVRIDDITGRVRIEQVMVQTEKMLSLGGLAAGMAHEINNPLGGIMLGAQNIRRRLTGDLEKNLETARELGITMEQLSRYNENRGVIKLLDGIVAMGERASQIVTNMLNFSRHGDVEKEPVSLDTLLDQTVELASHDYDLKKKYDFRHIQVDREYEEGLPPVPCNRIEIEQVILNLLKNSAQAMREITREGYRPRIVLRLYKRNNHAVMEVGDNGPGMDIKTRKRIFEPFFTTKDVGSGTGLGLSVSYYIITSNHRGAISVESEPGNGALFRISLPFNPDEAGKLR